MKHVAWLVGALAVVGFACGPTGAGDGNGGNGDGGNGIDAGRTPGADARPQGPTVDAAACVSSKVTAEEATAPVDIIWVVDSSGSMDDEASEVQGALNDFSAFIAGESIDYHVILIGDAGAMTVPAPLGGSPRFLHVDHTINSTDALEKTVQQYAQYQAFLRPNAKTHFVIVTDDESNWSQAQFEAGLAGLTNPGFPDGYTMHSICSEETVIFTPPAPLPPVMGPCSGGLGLGGAADPGLTYIDITANTGGVWRSICTADWTPVFSAVATAVTIGTELPCTYDLPDPPAGETLDPARVNVVFTPDGGSSTTIPRVGSATACGTGQGWYYDDPAAPTQIKVCPSTCTDFEVTGNVDIQFGCATIVN